MTEDVRFDPPGHGNSSAEGKPGPSISTTPVLLRPTESFAIFPGFLLGERRTARGGKDGEVVDELLHFAFTASGMQSPRCARWSVDRSWNGGPIRGGRRGVLLDCRPIKKDYSFHHTSSAWVCLDCLATMRALSENFFVLGLSRSPGLRRTVGH